MTIRAADTTDGAAIWDLLAPVFRAGDTYMVNPKISREDALAYWLSPDKTVFLAAEGGAELGTYYIRPNQQGGGAHVCNCGYVTARAARGRGIARAMLDHSLKIAKDMGFRAMQYNFVVATNTRAIDIWDRAGFDVVGRLPGAFQHPDEGFVDALVMWKNLVEEG
ncbi:MAG: N-acetyltransferase [Pseudomonadota bacterium]